jgi:hypothetical protein
MDEGLSILQYVDGTILFIEDDIYQAKNLKLELSTYEQLLGLKINFHKCELFFAMERSKTRKRSMPNFLVARAMPLKMFDYKLVELK